DRLAGAELEAASRDRDSLCLQAFQMHLDAPVGRVVKRAMTERCKIEVAAELAVHAPQDVDIEPRGDACRVVIGGVEDRLVLDQVDADDHGRTADETAARLEQAL